VNAPIAPRAGEPAIAIVFSPEPWVEALHAYLADHGGARVRQVVLDPQVAWEEEYDALVVSHRWPSLTLALVDKVHARGRYVVGVYDVDEPGAREHLEALGVDAVVESVAAPPAFVAALAAVVTSGSLASPGPPSPTRQVSSGPQFEFGDGTDSSTRRRDVLAVSGGAGSGVTEVAIGLAAAVATSRDPVVLVDADAAAGSMAARLGLPIEPNLRTAVDAVAHGLGELGGALARPRSSRLRVLCGFPSAAAAAHVAPHEVVDVLHALSAEHDCVVVDTGGRPDSALAHAVVANAGTLVDVGAGNPVGVARLLAWISEWRPLFAGADVHLVVNRAPVDRYRRHEIAAEIARTFEPASLVFVPADRRVDTALWDGDLVGSGAFTSALAPLVDLVRPPASRRGDARRPARRGRGRTIAVSAP
jgi:MinD-like ATPase involved in chromosome partitioning or flagellar assembly